MDSTPWTFCYSLTNDECITGSTPGQMYVSIPQDQTANTCLVNSYSYNAPCIANNFPYGFWAIQYNTVVNDTTGLQMRRLTEIGHAFNGRKRIVPFRLSSVALPADLDYFLSMTQWLDAPDGCTDQNLKRLTDAAEEALERQAGSGPLVRRKKPRAVLFASVAAAVLAVGALAYWKWPKPADQPVPAKEASNSASSSPPSARADLPKRKTWLNPQDGQTYVWIPPGSFTMGCSSGDGECRDDEKPAHPVEIEKGFWLAQTEVTNAVYRRFRGSKGHKPEAGDENLPVTNVSWPGAKAYCAAVGGRLPTEAEWEYAARAGKPEIYYGVPLKVAWYEANSDGAPHPVGTKEPNAFGLYDMLGNASEWVLDRYYNKYYVDAAATGAVDQPLAGNATAVARGGYWDADAASLRVSHRSELPNDEPVPTAGIRCASDHIEP